MYEMLVGMAPFHARSRNQLFQNIMENNINFRKGKFTLEEKDLIQNLCRSSPKKRLGCGPGGVDEIKDHPYFRGLNWNHLERKNVQPPYVPPLKSETDLRNFDKMFTGQKIKDTPTSLVRSSQGIIHYDGFTFLRSTTGLKS